MKKLKGNVAVVTGASGGIGRAIAQRYAHEGAKVAICDINNDMAQETAADINNNGGQAMAIEMDVSSETAVNSGIDEVAKKWGRIDTSVSYTHLTLPTKA